MLERDGLKALDEAPSILEQDFASMPELKITALPANCRRNTCPTGTLRTGGDPDMSVGSLMGFSRADR